MKTVIFIVALLTISTAHAADPSDVEDTPKPARFQPWQRMWQCNDIRVTETVNQPGIVHYDLGGTIWGGSQFVLNLTNGALFFNGRPCLPLPAAGLR